MRNVFAFAWRALRSDARRHGVSSITLLVGAALVVGAVLTGQAASETLRGGIDALGGVGDVAVVPRIGAPALHGSTVRAVEELPDVALAIPTYSHDAFAVRSGEPDVEGADVTVTGVAESAVARLHGVLLSGRWPANDDELVVPDSLADDLAVERGDRLRVGAHDGGHELVVSGIADAKALGLFAVDNLFSTVEGAWHLAGVSDQYTRVELMVSAADRSAWAERIRPSLPAGTTLQDTSAAVDALGPIARTTNALVIGTGGIAAIVATVLAAGTGAELRRRRRRTADVLRAIGAPRGWVRRAFVVETTIVGMLASMAGAGAGVIASLIVCGSVGGQCPTPSTVLSVVGVVIVVGTAVMMLTSAIAVRDRSAARAGSVSRGALATLVVSGGGSAVCMALPLGLTGDCVALLGTFLAAAAGAVLARPLVGRALRRLHWTAAGTEQSNAGPLSVMVAVVTIFSAALLSAATGVSDATQRQISAQFGADVQVTSSTPLPVPTRDAVEDLRRVRSVADSSVATVNLTSRSHQAEVPALGVDRNWFDVEDLAWRSGTESVARRALVAGRGVAVPQALADRFDLAVGDGVTLALDGRTSRAEVIATFTSLATGDQIVTGPTLRSALGFPPPTGWDIALTPGSDPVAVRDQIADLVQSVPGAVAVTASEMRGRAEQQLVATFAGVFVLVGLASVLGAIGTAGSYRMVVDRRRAEFAVLRAIGARRRDLRAIVRWEWGASTAAALLPAALFGTLAVQACGHAVDTLLGVTVPVSSSLPPLGIAFALVTATMALATAGPARAAATIPPSEALREDR